MSCNDLICIFKFGLLLNFIAHNSQGILCSKYIVTLIRSRSITTGLFNNNKFLEAIKLSLHQPSSKARRNHKLVCSNIYIIANQSYIAKLTFRMKLLLFTYKIANNFVVLLVFHFAKMDLLLSYTVCRPFWDWTLYFLSGYILLEGHYILKNSVLCHTRQG